MADLTYIQRIALRGDIGKLISSICKYEEDDPYVCFMCLTIYGSELHEEVISILKELFDEEIVDRMYCYVQSRIIPYSIWVNKVIADFLSLLGCAELESDKDVIRSCFCNYLNRVKEVSLYACHVLLNSVLKKEELELIHKEAFYLIHNIPFPEKVQVEGDDRPDKADVDAKFFADARIFGIAVASTDVLPIDEFVPEIYPPLYTLHIIALPVKTKAKRSDENGAVQSRQEYIGSNSPKDPDRIDTLSALYEASIENIPCVVYNEEEKTGTNGYHEK